MKVCQLITGQKGRALLYLASIAFFVTSCAPAAQQDAANELRTNVYHPEWTHNANIYEVNVRQITPEGTFNAFAEHLPRLKEMGVEILWFMPIHPIGVVNRKGTLGSYYSIKDFRGINPEFGTMEDFKNLVNKIHELDMKIILDWVANHTAWDHHWTVTNPEFYTRDENGNFIAPNPDWSDVKDLDFGNRELWDAMIADMLFWVRDVNVDGFRCDVAYLVPTEFWELAATELNKVKPVFMLAEAEYPPLNVNAFHMSYGWRFHHMMNAIAQGEQNVSSLDEYFFIDSMGKFPIGSYKMQFIDNHDENSWNGTVYERLGEGKKSFAVLAATTPGMFLIYNGQEAVLDQRLEFFEKDTINWSDLRYEDFYRRLLLLKRDNQALWNGAAGGPIERIKTNNDTKIFAFKREKADYSVVVILNLTPEIVPVSIVENAPRGRFTNLFTDESRVRIPSEFEMGAWEYKVFYQ